jgi:hypothetical protein
MAVYRWCVPSCMIRELRDGDVEAFVELRREALLDSPLAFVASPSDDLFSSPGTVREQLRRAPKAVILGCFSAMSCRCSGPLSRPAPEVITQGASMGHVTLRPTIAGKASRPSFSMQFYGTQQLCREYRGFILKSAPFSIPASATV